MRRWDSSGRKSFFKSFRRLTENHSSRGRAAQDNTGLGPYAFRRDFMKEIPSDFGAFVSARP